MQDGETRTRTILIGILALALVIRLGAIVATPDYEPIFDSGDYVRHAESIAAGDGFPQSVFTSSESPSAFRPPLYPYVLGAVYTVFGDGAGDEAGRVLGALAGVLVVYLIFLLGRALWSARVGLWSAGLAAILPPLAFLNEALISEPLFLAMELGVILAALAARRAGGDWRLAALAGLLCGLAALTRSNGILLVIPAAIAVWVGRPWLGRPALAAPLAVVVAAGLTVVPWTIRNTLEFDQLVPFTTQSGFAMAGAFNDEARGFPGYPATWTLPQETALYGPIYTRTDLDEAELDQELRSTSVEYMADHPGYVAEVTVRNVLRTFELMGLEPSSRLADERQLGLSPGAARAVRASYYVLALFAIAGLLALARWERGRRGDWWIWLVPVLMVLAAAWVIASTRYRIPAYPFMVFLAAIAIVDLLERRRLDRPPLPARGRSRPAAEQEEAQPVRRVDGLLQAPPGG